MGTGSGVWPEGNEVRQWVESQITRETTGLGDLVPTGIRGRGGSEDARIYSLYVVFGSDYRLTEKLF